MNTVAFKVYDMDRDGYISNGELFLVLKMMVGSNLKVCSPPHRSPMIVSGLTILGGRTRNCNKSWIRPSWKQTKTETANSVSRSLRRWSRTQ